MQEQTYGLVSLRTKTFVWDEPQKEEKKWHSLWERQKNNEVKLEQHHIITLVEFGQRQSTIISLCVEKKEKDWVLQAQ